MKTETKGKPMFDENGRFVMNTFETVVEGVKDLALEAQKVPELEDKVKELEGKVQNIASTIRVQRPKGSKDTEDLPEPTPSLSGPRDTKQGKVVRDYGFMGISSQVGLSGFDIVIGFKRPEDGKYTTKHVRRNSIYEAVIARNEIAATLLREHIIDFNRYLEIVRG